MNASGSFGGPLVFLGTEVPVGKGGNTVKAVEALALPTAEELGLRIWDIRFQKEGSQWYLRIFIDKDEGVSIDDCVDFTHKINPLLDEADPIEQAYCLEVSSPGIERELTRPEHFEEYIGRKIMLKTIRPVDGKREFKGILEDYTAPDITVRFEDGAGLSLALKETAWVKADDFDI